MKILMCHDYYIDRGGEDFVFEYETDLLKRKGYDVVLYCKYNKSIDSLTKKVGVFLNFFFSFSTFREVERIIIKEKPDIAHIHNIFPLISPSIYTVFKKYKIPIVQTIHNFRFFCSNGLCFKNGKICTRCKVNKLINIFNICSKKRVYDFFLSIVIFILRKFDIYNRYIDYFIAPSEFIRKVMIECGIDRDKTIIKRNSLKKNEFMNKNETTKFSYKNKYFVYAGRLSEEKGIMNLLKEFKQIDDVVLKILGDGPLKKDIMKYISDNNLKNVELMGFVKGDKKIRIFKKALAAIIPSICFENCPLVLIESLILGTPVIVNDVGALTEYIVDGYNGYIYSDLARLKEIILELNGMKIHERYKLKESCKESFLRLFDEDMNFKIIDGVYKKLKKIGNY